MKLIGEYTTNNISFINEKIDEATGEKTLFIEGVFAQAEKQNRNKRIYPKKVLEPAIDTYIKEYVQKNRALGEINHPNRPNPDLNEACILITELKWNGNDVYGKAKVLETEAGNKIRALLKGGVQLGVSTRGLGSVTEKEGISIVESDYSIKAIDVVYNPSGIDCWVNGILENVEYWFDSEGVLQESTIDEYLKHKKNGNFSQIKEDFTQFLNGLHIL